MPGMQRFTSLLLPNKLRKSIITNELTFKCQGIGLHGMVPRPSFGQEQASQTSFWCWLLAAVSWPQRKNAAMTSVELLWNPVARLWCHLHAISLSQSANWRNSLVRYGEIPKIAACAYLIYRKDRADQMTWHRNSENCHGCHKGCPSESKIVFALCTSGLCWVLKSWDFVPSFQTAIQVARHGAVPSRAASVQLVIIVCWHSLQALMERVVWASVQKSSRQSPKPPKDIIHNALWSLYPKTCLLQHFFELLSRRSELVAVPHDLRRHSCERVDAGAFPTSSLLGGGTGVGIAGISTNWPMVGTWRPNQRHSRCSIFLWDSDCHPWFDDACFQATRHRIHCGLKKCPTPPSEFHLSFCLEIQGWNTVKHYGCKRTLLASIPALQVFT